MKPPNLADMRDKMAAQRAQMEASREQGQLKVEGLMLKAHREIYLRSGGRIGMTLLRVPSLLLTVSGRSTGMPQTVALVFATDGDDYVVAASNGGKLHNPDWLENLARHPSVELQIGTRRSKATAEIIDRNDPRYERLWRLVNTNNHGRYYRYQHMTTRAIPIVRLRPAE
jgi:deazaflavin-dependent oxidoreductase (nitroreductase family)